MHHEALNQLNKLLFSIIPTPFYILLQIALPSYNFVFSISAFSSRLHWQKEKKNTFTPTTVGVDDYFWGKRRAFGILKTLEKKAELQKSAQVSETTQVRMWLKLLNLKHVQLQNLGQKQQQ